MGVVLGRPKTGEQRACNYCGSTFYTQVAQDRKYCGTECHRAAMSLGLTKPKPVTKMAPRPCQVCSKVFKPTSGSAAKYCSNACYNSTKKTGKKRTSRNTEWIPGWTVIKQAVLQRDNYCCRRCGTSEGSDGKGTRGKGHAVHHTIDRQHNDLKDLITLCRPCHTAVTVVEQARELVAQYGDVHFNEYLRKV